MKIRYTKRFSKDLDNIANNEKLKKRLLHFLEEMQQINSLAGMKDVRKIQGYESYYRIRMGEYRLGVKVTKDCIEMLRFLHRKDIYKNFP